MKPNAKLAERAIRFLKREAFTDVRRGIKAYRSHTLGVILDNLGLSESYNLRDKNFQGIVASLNHAELLGLVETVWGSPLKRFRYCGSDIKQAVLDHEAQEAAEFKKINQVVRKHRLRGATIAKHQYRDHATEIMVEIPASTLYRILRVR